jgi:long-chain fatty acid transport protein
MLLHLGESVRVGVAYRSEIDVDFKGDLEIKDIAPALQPAFGGAKFKSTVRTSSTFPEIIGFGISWKPSERLVADFDAELVRWSSFDKQVIDIEDEVPAAGLMDTTVPQDWDDSWQYKLGVEYLPREHIALRAGYAFISEVVPEHTLGPGNPDADAHNFSVGFGYRRGRLVIDTSYMLGILESRTVNNSILSGEYDTRNHFLGSSVGYSF